MEKKTIELNNRPARELFWSEMNAEQRIEKLEKELERTQGFLKRLSEYITKLIDHDHKDGKLISVISHPNNESYGGFYFRVHEKK